MGNEISPPTRLPHNTTSKLNAACQQCAMAANNYSKETALAVPMCTYYCWACENDWEVCGTLDSFCVLKSEQILVQPWLDSNKACHDIEPIFGNEFTGEYVCNILLSKFTTPNMYLHFAAKLPNSELLLRLLLSVKNCGDFVIYQLLNAENNEGVTVMNLAAESGAIVQIIEFMIYSTSGILLAAIDDINREDREINSYEKVSELIDFFQQIVANAQPEKLIAILSKSDRFCRTFLHYSAILGLVPVFKIMIESDLCAAEKLELYGREDDQRNTTLHYLVEHKRAITKSLLEDIMSNEHEGGQKILDFLLKENRGGNRALHMAASKELTMPIIHYLTCELGHEYDSELYTQYYAISNNTGHNVCHILARMKQVDILLEILTNISEEKSLQLLTTCTEVKRYTVLHILANENLPNAVFQLLSKIRNPQTRVELLLQGDCDGFTPLHYLVLGIVSKSSTCSGVSGLRNLLSLILPSLIQPLLKCKNEFGSTILHYIHTCSSTDLVELLCDFSSGSLLDLLLIKNNHGETPFLLTLKCSNPFIAQYLINKIPVEKRKKLFLAEDNDGHNSLFWARHNCHDKIRKQILQVVNLDVTESLAVEPIGKAKANESEDRIFPRYVQDILDAGLVTIAYEDPARVEQAFCMTGSTLRSDFKLESARYKSFDKFESSCISAVSLAVAGFIHLEDVVHDAVVCVWCSLKLCQFMEYVNAVAIHKAYSANTCDFLKFNKRENQRNLTYGTADRHRKDFGTAISQKANGGSSARSSLMSIDEGFGSMSTTTNLYTDHSMLSSATTSSYQSFGRSASINQSFGRSASSWPRNSVPSSIDEGIELDSSPSSGYASGASASSGDSTGDTGIVMDMQEMHHTKDRTMRRPSNANLESNPIEGIEDDTDGSFIPTTNNILTVASESAVQSESSLSTDLPSEFDVTDKETIYRRYQSFFKPRLCIENSLWREMQSSFNRDTSNMHSEAGRLQTFLNKGWKKPTAEEFAIAGFFLADSNIKCIFCNNRLEISEGERESCSPLELHMQRFPSCKFIQGIKLPANKTNFPRLFEERVWNMSLKQPKTVQSDTEFEGLGIQTTQVVCPALGVIDRRRETFRTFPSRHPKGAEELAEAGYYYEGKGNSVTCFACAVVSDHWTTVEEAWKRHARSSRSCPFLLRCKGVEFVRAVIEEMGVYKDPEPENRLTQIANRMMRPRMDSIVVRKALELGYDQQLVRTAVGNRLKKLAADYTRVAELVEDLLALAPPHLQSRLSGVKKPTLPKMTSPPCSETSSQLEREVYQPPAPAVKNDASSEQPPPQEQTQTIVLDGLTEKEFASQLISQLTCKVCISDMVSIIFLPCGHFVCCTACSAAMTDCPICREGIRGTVKATFS